MLQVQLAICWNIRVSRTTSSVLSGWYRENVPGADNQQERLRLEGWVSGIIDGEGCFCVNVNRCTAVRLGWQVRPELVVTQGARSIGALETIQGVLHVWRHLPKLTPRQPSRRCISVVRAQGRGSAQADR